MGRGEVGSGEWGVGRVWSRTFSAAVVDHSASPVFSTIDYEADCKLVAT